MANSLLLNEKELKANGWVEFIPALKSGLEMERLSDFQIRIAGRLDIYTAIRRFRWSWHDIKTGERGEVHRTELKKFIPKHLETPIPSKESIAGQPSTLNEFEEGLEDLICASAPSKQIIEYVRAHIKAIEGTKR